MVLGTAAAPSSQRLHYRGDFQASGTDFWELTGHNSGLSAQRDSRLLSTWCPGLTGIFHPRSG